MALELATVEDLQDALPNVADGVARSAIRRASALVRAIARQQFDFVTADEVLLVGGGQDLTLPERPVFGVKRPLSNARRIRGSRGRDVPIERRR